MKTPRRRTSSRAGPRPNELGVLVDPAGGRPAPVPNRLGSAVRRARLPVVSGQETALLLLVLFAITAAVIPYVAHRPLWVEIELVLAAWWSIWVVLLTWLGYRGARVERDWRTDASGGSGLDLSVLGHIGGFDLPGLDFGSDDAVGCLISIVSVVALLVVAVAAVTLIVDVILVVVPALLGLLYAMAWAMLDRVVRAADQTRGRAGLSLARAIAWATAYTIPLVALVWLLHILI